MGKTTSFLLATAICGLAASAAVAAPVITITPGYEHSLKIMGEPLVGPNDDPPLVYYKSDAFGTGAGYSAEVDQSGNSVSFKSGAMAAGTGNYATSVTEVNLGISNLNGVAVSGLTSTIFQSTFGFYVAPFGPLPQCSGASLPSCNGSYQGAPTLSDFVDGGELPGNSKADFSFAVLIDGAVQSEFAGHLEYDANAGTFSGFSLINGTPGALADLGTVLPGFEIKQADGYGYFYGWDQSDFTVLFDSPITSDATVTYRLSTSAFADVVNNLESVRSVIAFSCFADPIGRGSTGSQIMALPTCEDFTDIGTAKDYKLTFGGIDKNGNLLLTSTAGIPEPETWATLIVGFGLIGLSMRRRKTLVTATISA